MATLTRDVPNITDISTRYTQDGKIIWTEQSLTGPEI